MFKTLSVLALILLLGISATNAMTPREAGELLSLSVGELLIGNASSCTVTKIAPKQFLTAKHCVSGLGNLKVLFDNETLFVKSVLTSTEAKNTGKGNEDWAIVNTSQDNDSIKALSFGCTETLYIGMPVAYLGYPYPASPAFSTGIVVSPNPVRAATGNESDFMVDLVAGPGASGSAVISMDTGAIIGVLTEGVRRARSGEFFLTGVESISRLDVCEVEQKTDKSSVTSSVADRNALVTPF